MNHAPRLSGALFLLTVSICMPILAATSESPSIEDRIAARRAVEEVLWQHRIWPPDNSQPKPPLSSVLPDTQIRAWVVDDLRKSQALATLWQRPVTAAMLQSELDRMRAGSRAPEVLDEMLAAVGNDPVLARESIARPALVDRLIRSWYAHDDRYQGEARARAEADMTTARTAEDLKVEAPSYHEITTVRMGTPSDPGRDRPGLLRLAPDDWTERLSLLARTTGGAAPGRPGPLRESDEAFYASIVLEAKPDVLKTGTAVWPKAGFEGWWDTHAWEFEPALDVPAGTAASPGRAAPSCADDTWTATGGASPARRYLHAAIWTGAEMIVWGGYLDGAALAATGGRYNPATDTWQTTSVIGAPSGRRGAGVVWTGSRMIVWGGEDSGGLTRTGGRYDPITDTWSGLSTAGAPTARLPKTSVWTGSKMVTWGGDLLFNPGTGGRYDPVADTWAATTTTGTPSEGSIEHVAAVWTGSSVIFWPGKRYDPVADAWSFYNLSGQPTPRDNFSGIWTGTELIVWGGFAGGTALNDGGRYNPSTDSWTPTTTASAPPYRGNHTAVWVGNRMVVWGGQDSNQFTLGSGGRYDPATDSWNATAATGAPSARYGHTAVATATEMIVWGGFTGFTLEPTGARYNPATDSWVPTRADGPSPSARSGHVAVWTGSEMIVWAGSDAVSGLVKSGGRYTPATDSWSPTLEATAPSARSGATAIWTGTRMLVWGGQDGGYAGTGGRYDPATDSWSAIKPTGAPAGRSDHSAVWTGSSMIVWGGFNASGDLATGGRYDPAADAWTPTSLIGSPGTRSLHTAVWGAGRMIVWGGASGGFRLDSGGRYDPIGDTWTMTSATSAPSARQSHVAVWTGQRMLVWGGENGPDIGTGSTYDPVADVWSGISTVNAPAARRRATAVWTGAEMIVWGGLSGTGYINSGGRYRPESDTWRATSGGSAPLPRALHTAVWMGAGMIVWGGTESSGGRYGNGAKYCACAPWYPDVDGDGYGSSVGIVDTCDGTAPAGYVGRTGDCNDANAGVHPGAVDNTCNGVDDDCNGAVDDLWVGGLSHCGLGVCRSSGIRECIGGQVVDDCVPGTPTSPTDVVCNALDDDCDGAVDEDFAPREDYWTATASAPQTRTNHTVVWSGSEMIVFGGDNGAGTVKAGGEAYAPATNTWRSLAAGPLKRWHHSAVWTGSRMVVWGGDDNVATVYNSGSRYDPATDSWVATTTTSAPTARGGHSAVWTGSRVVIWGGRDPAGYLNTGSRYDPVGNTWVATGTTGAPTARWLHSAVWTGTEMIVWGGQTDPGTGPVALRTGGRYNPTTNTWAAVGIGGAPSIRYGHVAVWTGSEMLIWGGTDGSAPRGDGARYNPSTNTWVTMSSAGAPSIRAWASFAWTGTELLVWGGSRDNNPLGDGARYNPATDTWTSMSSYSALAARARGTAVWTGTEMIIWGGDPNGAAMSDGGRYNPKTICGTGGCQRTGATYCAAGVAGFQCVPAAPMPEVCDGIDNNCNVTVDEGIPVPTGHPAIFTAKLNASGDVQLTWSVTPDTTGYDIARGTLGVLRATAGDYTTATNACLGNDVSTPSLLDTAQPAAGDALWYLVRPVNTCSGAGTYNDTQPPQQGSRDGEIAACP